jgi:hypothetical protein
MEAELRGIQGLEEGTFDGQNGTVTIRVFKPGVNKGRTVFYPREVLERDHTCPRW